MTTATAPAAHDGAGTILARFLTSAVEPKNVIVVVCTWICTAHYGWTGIIWAVLSVLFAAVLPLIYIRHVTKSWADRHLDYVRQRARVMPVIVASVAAGAALLWALGAPREVLAMMAAMAATLMALLPFTAAGWKISGHTSVSTGGIVMLAVALSPTWLLALVIVPPVAWARVWLRAHTSGQVIAGSLVGALAAGLVFALCR